MHNFDLGIGDLNVRARFFDIAAHVVKHLARVLATIANAAYADFRDLPAVLLIDLGDRHFKLVADARYDGFYNLPFVLE